MCKLYEVEAALNGVGYIWTSKEQSMGAALKGGLKSQTLLHIVRWITDEIRVLAKLDEKISSDTSDISSFQLELSSFLKELQCPIPGFVTGPVSNRFQTEDSLVSLLNFLLSELMAQRMMRQMNPKNEDMVIKLVESDTAATLKQIAFDLNLGKPPKDVATGKLFEQINKSLSAIIASADPARMGKPLFTPGRELTDQQWDAVKKFQQELDAEYELRRQMLITRLDVTVQSFQWSDRARSNQDDIESRYSANRRLLESMLCGGESTSVAALLAAREDLTIIEKTSNSSIRTHSDVQKHIMGLVPDRGGRTNEHAAPAREMPSWKSRMPNNPSRGGRGGHQGGANNRGGYQPQRQQPPQNSGYPAHSSGYQQHVGYGAGNGGGRQHNDNRGGGQNRVQGGWSQQGSNSNGYSQGDSQGQGDNRGHYRGGRGGRGGRRGNIN